MVIISREGMEVTEVDSINDKDKSESTSKSVTIKEYNVSHDV
jgi:hypothetical protein